MAVTMGLAARDAAGKIMALWFPVVLFVICVCVSSNTTPLGTNVAISGL